ARRVRPIIVRGTGRKRDATNRLGHDRARRAVPARRIRRAEADRRRRRARRARRARLAVAPSVAARRARARLRRALCGAADGAARRGALDRLHRRRDREPSARGQPALHAHAVRRLSRALRVGGASAQGSGAPALSRASIDGVASRPLVLKRLTGGGITMTTHALRTVSTAASATLAGLVLASASFGQGAPDGEWPTYGGDLGHTRYAPLDQIDASNFGSLELAWRFSTANLGPTPEYRFQSTPLVVDGVLYTTGGSRRAVTALDAATGEQLWVYSLNEGERGAEAPRRLSGRGLAFWQRGDDKRVVYITPGYRLIALDAATGRPIESFGDGGIVDLRDTMDQGDDWDPRQLGTHSPPTIAN